MADEIQATTSLTLNNGNVRANYDRSVSVAQTTGRFTSGVQSIGTAHEAITLPADITTPGMSVFTNASATNFVELGVLVSGTFYPIAKLKAGDAAQFRLGTTSLYARADTAAVELQFLILAD